MKFFDFTVLVLSLLDLIREDVSHAFNRAGDALALCPNLPDHFSSERRSFLHFERSENNNRVMKETLKQQEST